MSIIGQYTKEELEQIVQQSKSFTEVVYKLGYNAKGQNINLVKDTIKKLNIDTSHFGYTKPQQRTVENIFIENSTASQSTLRRWYIKGNYTPYVCSICGQKPIWQDKELTLILDHINGKNHDDRLENLRWVCPNCNQQLDTTGYKKMRTINQPKKHYYCKCCGVEIGHNTKNNLCPKCFNETTRICKRPSRDELKQLIRTIPFTTISKKYGVTDNAIRKWCDSYGLPRRVSDIKQYSNEEWLKI